MRSTAKISRPISRLGNQTRRTDCLRRYFLARTAPFDPRSQGACVPMGDGGRTFKQETDLDYFTNMTSGTGQGGLFIGVHPSVANNESTLSFATLNAGINTTLDAATEAAVVYSRGALLATTSFGSGVVEQRMVGCGIEVYNLGPPLYAQGMAGSYLSPSAASTAGTTTISSLLSEFNTRLQSMSTMLDEPLKDYYDLDETNNLCDWQTNSKMNGLTANYIGGLQKGCWWIWVPADSQGNVNVRIRVRAHWELRGRTVTPAGTVDEPDPSGFMLAAAKISGLLRSMAHMVPSRGDMLAFAVSLGGLSKLALHAPMNGLGPIMAAAAA